MGALGENLSLMLKIRADGSQAVAEAQNTSKKIIDANGRMRDEFGRFLKSTESGGAGLEKLTTNSTKTAAALEGLAGKLGLSVESASALSMALPAVGAVIAGIASTVASAAVGLFALAKSASDYGSEIYDASKKTGLGTESLSALKYAAETSGSSLEAVSGGLNKFQKLIGEAANGSKQASAKLKMLGVEPLAAMNDFDGALEKVFKKIKDAPNDTLKGTVAVAAFGKGGRDLIPVFDTVGGSLDEFKKKAAELGLTLSEKDAAAADEFGDTLDTVKAQLGGASREFAFGFMPAFTSGMNKVSELLAQNKGEMRAWGEYVGEILSGVIDWWGRASDATDGYFGNFKDQYDKSHSWLNTGLFGVLPVMLQQRGAELQKQQQDREKQIADMTVTGDPGTFSKFRYGADSKMLSPDKPLGADLDDYSTKVEKADKKVKEAIPNFNALLAAMRGASMGQESGGNKGAVNGRTSASGLFQVLPKNIPEWTRNTPGVGEMTVEEFKKDASAQIKVYNNYMGRYLRKGLAMSGGDWEKAVRIAAVQWYGTGKGEGLGFDDGRVFQKGEPSRAQYTKSILGRTKKNLKLKTLTGDDFDEFEDQQKVNAQIVADREKTDNRILELDKANGAERKATLDQILEQQLISQKDYADQVAQIAIDQLIKEKQILEERATMPELNGEQQREIAQKIALITSEIKVKSTEQSTEAIKNETTALERQKEITQEIADLRRKVTEAQRAEYDFTQEQQRKVLANEVEYSSGRERLDALVVLRSFDLSEAKRKHEQAIEDLEAEKEKALDDLDERAKKDVELKKRVEAQKKAIEDYYLSLKEQADAEKSAADFGINKEYHPQIKQAQIESTNGGMFGEGLAGALGKSVITEYDEAGNAVNKLSGAYKALGEIGGQAFSGLAQGIGSMIQNLVLLGNTGGQGFRKLVASVLAGASAQAATLAVMELAYGLAALTPWGFALYGNPALHFQAAALFGSIAVGTGIAGRLAAGSSFASGSSSASNAFSSDGKNNDTSTAEDKNREIIESRRQAQEADRKTTLDLMSAVKDMKTQVELKGRIELADGLIFTTIAKGLDDRNNVLHPAFEKHVLDISGQ